MLEHMKSHVRMLDVRRLTSLVIYFLSNVNLFVLISIVRLTYNANTPEFHFGDIKVLSIYLLNTGW